MAGRLTVVKPREKLGGWAGRARHGGIGHWGVLPDRRSKKPPDGRAQAGGDTASWGWTRFPLILIDDHDALAVFWMKADGSEPSGLPKPYGRGPRPKLTGPYRRAPKDMDVT